MGQAMITPMFWRFLGREAGESLLSDEEDSDTFLGRKWRMGLALISRLLRQLLSRKSPQVPCSSPPLLPLSLPHHHCIDIGINCDDGGGSDRDFIIDLSQQAEVEEEVEVEVEEPPPIREFAIEDDVHVKAEGGDSGQVIDKLLAPAKGKAKAISGRLGPYSWDEKILLVGEGDFSFSASLALAFGDASNIISTSLDSFEFLMKNYKRAESNISKLASKGCKVVHGVDATKMVNHPRLRSLKFDCIVFNFPHAGFANPGGSRDAAIRMHQRLVKGFLANAKKMIKADGQIHITHKCVGFLLQWNLEGVGSTEGLRLVEETPFDLRDYPGYSTKYGYGGDRSFDCRPCKRYKFQLLTSPKKKKTQRKQSILMSDCVVGSDNLSPKEEQLRWGKIGPYSGDTKIMVVGDGDFSFSASLAAAFGDASNLVATSLDSFEYLTGNYKRAEANILALRSRGCNVIHGVDATSMAINYPQHPSLKFNYIVFNFPKAKFSNPKPPRDVQLSKHQELVRGFLANAKKMIQGNGQIHITHQCFGLYLEWNITMLGSSEGLQLVEESPFNHRDYRDYCVKFGCTGDGGFDCSPSKTYKYQLLASPKRPRRRKPQERKIS